MEILLKHTLLLAFAVQLTERDWRFLEALYFVYLTLTTIGTVRPVRNEQNTYTSLRTLLGVQYSTILVQYVVQYNEYCTVQYRTWLDSTWTFSSRWSAGFGELVPFPALARLLFTLPEALDIGLLSRTFDAMQVALEPVPDQLPLSLAALARCCRRRSTASALGSWRTSNGAHKPRARSYRIERLYWVGWLIAAHDNADSNN